MGPDCGSGVKRAGNTKGNVESEKRSKSGKEMVGEGFYYSLKVTCYLLPLIKNKDKS